MAIQDKIQEDTLFGANTQAPTNDSGFVDNLEFSEPETVKNFDLGEERLFENIGGVNEEALFLNPDSINEEVLYKDGGVEFGVEELNVNSEVLQDNKEYYIAEEVLEFSEPTRPLPVSEEVLFREEEEEIKVADEDSPSILTDSLFAINEYSSLDLSSDEPKPIYVEKNFAQKLLEADEEILSRYNELKNYMLSYKGVKSRVSNDFDSFNIGRTPLIKLGYSTKSLKLYLNLDFDTVEPRLKCKNAGHKKAYEQVPVFLRIKSPRAMKNAKYLIDKVVERFSLNKNSKAVSVNSIEILKNKAKTYN